MSRKEKDHWKGSNLKYPKSFDDNIPYFDKYLARYSEDYRNHRRNYIVTYNLWLQKQGVNDILAAEYDDIEKFFREEINTRDIKAEGKEKWRKSLNSYYEFIRKIYKKKKKVDKFFNPVPDRDLYSFDVKIMTKDDLVLEQELLDFDSASKILSYLYYADKEFMYYIIVSFLFYTGARIKEIRTLLEYNIDLNNRFIFNFIKGTAFGQRYGVYFFPGEFVQDIKLYIDEKHDLYPNDPYMFPSPTAKGQFITDKTINKHLNRTCKFLGISHVPHSCHYFRDLINRTRRKKGVAQLDRIILLNQTPKETESKHYNKDLKIILELRNLYDKTYPFPKFRPNKDFLKK